MALDELAKALATYPQRSNFALAINWCLLPGTNDSPSDALAIADFAKQVGRCMINLIPYNPGSHPLCAPPSISEVLTFQELLNQRGLQSRIRSSFGRSIMAACGQLGGQIINKADSSDSHFHS